MECTNYKCSLSLNLSKKGKKYGTFSYKEQNKDKKVVTYSTVASFASVTRENASNGCAPETNS